MKSRLRDEKLKIEGNAIELFPIFISFYRACLLGDIISSNLKRQSLIIIIMTKYENISH